MKTVTVSARTARFARYAARSCIECNASGLEIEKVPDGSRFLKFVRAGLRSGAIRDESTTRAAIVAYRDASLALEGRAS